MICILKTVGRGQCVAACCAWSIVAMVAAAAHADRVYSFNSYPSEQGGGTLVGSITVTDTAPDDGILSIAEVLAWNWTATNGPLALAANSTEENAFYSPGGSGATITETDILLAEGSMLFGVENPESNAGLLYDQSSSMPGLYLASSGLVTIVWGTAPAPNALGGDPWVIATLVPEPGTAALLISALLAIGLMLVCRRIAALG
ncbi:MAG: PEP-CTERM sorting domain-containing protein [Planctomycetota bacterium]|nr:MAG: PEP-CTERM sorting domain-containing protein [Planctomycetota bacterium]